MGSTRPPVGAALLLAVVAALLAGCGDSGDGSDRATPGAGAEGGATVTIEDYLFEPARIAVPTGTTVTFANRDPAPHTATSKAAGVFDSGSVQKGETGEVTLEEPGTFAYYCLFHPFMKGTIIVD